ncbi:hypothetical protein OG609_04190 [Streptomyces sp. NBC_01224]|uniref:hypothetical protein n=1 Tax=unclassified Streptomyces TaxID=2593676 RepID=UPI002E10E8FE|nr:hypothetical protein OG609_04190 [Streptomyces sp. NBC_01224]
MDPAAPGRLLDGVPAGCDSSVLCSTVNDLEPAGRYPQGVTLHQLGNRLGGILHGCLKTRTRYDAATAWSHRTSPHAT